MSQNGNIQLNNSFQNDNMHTDLQTYITLSVITSYIHTYIHVIPFAPEPKGHPLQVYSTVDEFTCCFMAEGVGANEVISGGAVCLIGPWL